MISEAREKAIREYLRRSESLLAPNDLEKGMESSVRDLLADRDEQKERIAALEKGENFGVQANQDLMMELDMANAYIEDLEKLARFVVGCNCTTCKDIKAFHLPERSRTRVTQEKS